VQPPTNGHLGLADAVQQRPHEQDGDAVDARVLLGDLAGDLGCVQRERVVVHPLVLGSQLRQHRAGVASISPMRGTLVNVHGSSVSSVATSSLVTAFFAPGGAHFASDTVSRR
jgi:hypothetical protein